MALSLQFFAFLLLAITVSHAALPAQVYWNSKLPKTPMPSSIRDLLRPDVLDEKAGWAVSVGKGGVNVNVGKGTPGGTTVGVGKGGVGVHVGGQSGTHVGVGKGGVGVNVGEKRGTQVGVGKGGVGVNVGGHGGGTHVGVGKGGVGVNVGKKGGTQVGVGKGGVGVNVGGHGGGTHVGVGKGGVGVVVGGPKKKPYGSYIYNYAAKDDQLRDDPTVSLFFLEKDLHKGTKMNLQFTRTTSGPSFLPRGEATSVPFSSSKLPEILARFSVEPNSVEAASMKKTLEECEAPAVKGERKYCATSLESMVDFTTASLGTSNVRALSTEVEKEDTVRQPYTIASSGVEKLAGEKTVACHSQEYAYAVFYCHVTSTTKAYVVPLVGKDGTKVEAVALCHTDTSAWNPKHVAFKVLNVKPGTVPVCHFLPQDHIVWTPTNSN